MHRTTILLPEELRASAEACARRKGISLAELIRRQLKAAVRQSKTSKAAKAAAERRNDPLFLYYLGKGKHRELIDDTVTDAALNHDKYLAEAMEAEVRRWHATYKKK